MAFWDEWPQAVCTVDEFKQYMLPRVPSRSVSTVFIHLYDIDHDAVEDVWVVAKESNHVHHLRLEEDTGWTMTDSYPPEEAEYLQGMRDVSEL